MKNLSMPKEVHENNKVKMDDLYEEIHEIIEGWPNWKKQAYNDNFAISNYSKKLVIIKDK